MSSNEVKALSVLSELYSGFYDPKVVAKELSVLPTPVERLEELVQYRLHPLLYTQLAWRGTGFESQKGLTEKEVQDRRDGFDQDKQGYLAKLASDKLWSFSMKAQWDTVREEIVRLRKQSQEVQTPDSW